MLLNIEMAKNLGNNFIVIVKKKDRKFTNRITLQQAAAQQEDNAH